MNTNAIALEVLRRSIEVSTKEFKHHFWIFFDCIDHYLADSLRSRRQFELEDNQESYSTPMYCVTNLPVFCSARSIDTELAESGEAPELVWENYSRGYDEFGGMQSLQDAFRLLRSQLTTKLRNTFSENPDTLSEDLKWVLANPNITNTRYIRFLDDLLRTPEFWPRGGEDNAADKLFGYMDYFIEGAYARANYIGIARNPSASAEDSIQRYMDELVNGLADIRARGHLGLSEAYGISVEGVLGTTTTHYLFRLEEIRKFDDQIFRTFAQSFTAHTLPSKLNDEQSCILRTERIALNVTIRNLGGTPPNHHRNGPLRYWYLGSEITI